MRAKLSYVITETEWPEWQRRLNETGGFSVKNGRVYAPTTGYAVSLPSLRWQPLAAPPLEESLRAAVNEAESLRNPREFVGVWRDSETGRVYVDTNVWVFDLERAKHFGFKYGQKAIWSFADAAEIRLG